MVMVWNLSISGQDLPFDYGSFKGRIDSEIKMTGPLTDPLIKGEVLTHDFLIAYPLSWPVQEEEEPVLNPDWELVFYPGENVYLRNDYIDVLIQKGNLGFSFLGRELNFDGVLESEQGSFDFYSNKFLLTRGEVAFTPFTGYIPDLNVEAETRISGARIIAQLQGPADNMIVTFRSQPEMDEEEILSLLTSKGGLGSFYSGDWSDAIRKEIVRFFSDRIRLSLVENVEEKIGRVLQLDRVEIDTYNLGWQSEITYYLGKYISDKVYLQYSRTINSEEDDFELALRYYLSDRILFEGSWQGEDDFNLSIETNLQF